MVKILPAVLPDDLPSWVVERTNELLDLHTRLGTLEKKKLVGWGVDTELVPGRVRPFIYPVLGDR